jgi:trk system potassium uptake protein TrkH
MGACGGSTGGGIKVSRLIILTKSGVKDIKKAIHPRSVNSLKFEGEVLSRDVERNTRTYFIIWFTIVVLSTLLLSFDSFDANGGGLWTHLSASITCIGNVGPGLTNVIGATGSFAGYNWFSKLVLCFDMLAGRLEIFPMILLFAPRTWRRN